MQNDHSSITKLRSQRRETPRGLMSENRINNIFIFSRFSNVSVAFFVSDKSHVTKYVLDIFVIRDSRFGIQGSGSNIRDSRESLQILTGYRL